MAFNYQDMTMTFFEMLNHFYSQNKNKIRKCYKDLTRKYLDFNDKSINKDAFLRKPQFEALEMYVFLKEFMKNKSVKEIFEDWKKKEGEFSKEKYILSGEQVSIYEMAINKKDDYMLADCIYYEWREMLIIFKELLEGDQL